MISAEEDRKRRGQKIVANPEGYKICEGCGNILRRNVVICSSCHSYRFSFDGIAALALLLASRPAQGVQPEDFY